MPLWTLQYLILFFFLEGGWKYQQLVSLFMSFHITLNWLSTGVRCCGGPGGHILTYTPLAPSPIPMYVPTFLSHSFPICGQSLWAGAVGMPTFPRASPLQSTQTVPSAHQHPSPDAVFSASPVNREDSSYGESNRVYLGTKWGSRESPGVQGKAGRQIPLKGSRHHEPWTRESLRYTTGAGWEWSGYKYSNGDRDGRRSQSGAIQLLPMREQGGCSVLAKANGESRNTEPSGMGEWTLNDR